MVSHRAYVAGLTSIVSDKLEVKREIFLRPHVQLANNSRTITCLLKQGRQRSDGIVHSKAAVRQAQLLVLVWIEARQDATA